MLVRDDIYKDDFCQNVIYHVAPMLTTDEQRRLIGNYLVVIIFLEKGATLDPLSLVTGFGQVPQAFVVVLPVEREEGIVKYRLSYIIKDTLPYFWPSAPDLLLDQYPTKQLILTKLINAALMTHYYAPFDHFFYRPRGEALKDLATKFPHNKKSHGFYKKWRRFSFARKSLFSS